MNDKIKNLFDLLKVGIEVVENNNFILYTLIKDDVLITTVPCSKYAKFIINDFKSLENKYGKQIYDIDGAKIKALFAISEQYEWYSRKELVDFLESEFRVGG